MTSRTLSDTGASDILNYCWKSNDKKFKANHPFCIHLLPDNLHSRIHAGFKARTGRQITGVLPKKWLEVDIEAAKHFV
jgi:hypothetical protein